VKGDTGDTGPQGDQGVEISAVEPENLTVLWADTSEEGDAVLPLGGAAGQSLVKVSGDDYDTTWADLDTDGVSEGTVNLYNRVPTGGSAGEVLVKQSATDYDGSVAGRPRRCTSNRQFYFGVRPLLLPRSFDERCCRW
jgi:hypothetical protein